VLAARKRRDHGDDARGRYAEQARREKQITGVGRAERGRGLAPELGRRVVEQRQAARDAVKTGREPGEHEREAEPCRPPPLDAMLVRGEHRGEHEQQPRLREIEPVKEDAHCVRAHRAETRKRAEIQVPAARERGRRAENDAREQRGERRGEARFEQTLVRRRQRVQAVDQRMVLAHGHAFPLPTMRRPCMRSWARPQ
jgi:hypothetical protein